MNWYKITKYALRGNIEIINNPDQVDPYRNRKPISNLDGQGYDLNRFGDEGANSSVGGTEARGQSFPRNFSSKAEEYENQRRRDIPDSWHMFVDDHDQTMLGSGQGVDSINQQTFSDNRDRLPTEYQTFGNEPSGPVNMQKNLGWKRNRETIFQRVKRKLKGAYNG